MVDMPLNKETKPNLFDKNNYLLANRYMVSSISNTNNFLIWLETQYLDICQGMLLSSHPKQDWPLFCLSSYSVFILERLKKLEKQCVKSINWVCEIINT